MRNRMKKKEEKKEERLPRQTIMDASQARNQYLKVTKCFNCNEDGHRVSQCSKPPRLRGSCYNCGSKDHKARDCPRNQQGRQSTQMTKSIFPLPKQQITETKMTPSRSTYESILFVEERPQQAYMIMVTLINNSFSRKVKCIVDTGSPISLVRIDLVDSLDIMTSNEKQNFEGINKSKLDVLGFINLTVKVSEIQINLTLYVVPNHTIPYKCLLGRDFISNDNIIVSFVSKVCPLNLHYI